MNDPIIRTIPTTKLTFEAEELVDLGIALGNELERVGEVWDQARADAPENASYWQEKHDRLARLNRKLETAQKRIARKGAS